MGFSEFLKSMGHGIIDKAEDNLKNSALGRLGQGIGQAATNDPNATWGDINQSIKDKFHKQKRTIDDTSGIQDNNDMGGGYYG
jgi:hypothetical protein